MARYRPADATEAALVEGVRANLLDDQVREVYADWLEQHGFDLRAKLLRGETEAAIPGIELAIDVRRLAPKGDELWRALASRAEVSRCRTRLTVNWSFPCPKAWSALAPTADDTVRHCATCQRPVYYVASVEEARLRGAEKACIAIDAAMVRGEALSLYDTHANMDMMMGEVAEVEDDPTVEDLTWQPTRCGGPDVDD